MRFKMQSYILFAKDMARMRRFYEGVLGLKAATRPPYPAEEWLELKGAGFKLCLHRSSAPGSAPGNRNKLVFRVDDVKQARAWLVSKRVKMGAHHHWPHADACDGHDPEGNKFQITGPRTPED
ncbi:MAG: VOC family protein [Planctomycetota bacterium]|nr:VOC family protein [Planctomycetota bacterium]